MKKIVATIFSPFKHICRILGISGIHLFISISNVIQHIFSIILGLWFFVLIIFFAINWMTNTPISSFNFWFLIGTTIVGCVVFSLISGLSLYLEEYSVNALDSLLPKSKDDETDLGATTINFYQNNYFYGENPLKDQPYVDAEYNQEEIEN